MRVAVRAGLGGGVVAKAAVLLCAATWGGVLLRCRVVCRVVVVLLSRELLVALWLGCDEGVCDRQTGTHKKRDRVLSDLCGNKI